MNKLKAILTVGAPASGKTTWAKQWCKDNPNWLNICRDDIRFSLGPADGWESYKFKKSFEDTVTKIQYGMFESAAKGGKSIVVSDTNLSEKTRNSLMAVLSSLGFDVEVKVFDVPLEELWERDKYRGDRAVGREVIYRMYRAMLDYKGRKRYSYNNRLPAAFLCDLDGTLALMWGRSPYDWNRVYEDEVNTPVAQTIQALAAAGNKIVIVSGRDGCCEADSKLWLKDNGIPYDEFFIRSAGDVRKDTVVKEEMFWEHIAPSYNVLGVFDDRPTVCRMWMELGLQVFNVGNPYLEF